MLRGAAERSISLISILKSVLAPIPLSACTGILVTLLFFVANWFVISDSPDSYRSQIAEAFVDGTLGASRETREIREHAGNECVFLSSFVVDYESHLKRAVSPKRIVGFCETLREFLENPQTAPVDKYYHRYLQGFRTPAAILFTFMSVNLAFKSILFISIALLLVGLYSGGKRAVGATRAAVTVEGRYAALQSETPTFLILVSFALFFGLSEFGARITHGLWGVAIIGFIVWAFNTDLYRMRFARFVVAIALFGALIAQFEFFTGAAPLGLAVTIGIVALRSQHVVEASEFWERIWTAASAFFVGFVACYLFKLLVVGLVFGWAELGTMSGKLTERAWGDYTDEINIATALEFGFDPRGQSTYSPYSLFFVIAKLAYSTTSIAFGSRIMGICAVAAGVISLLVGAVYLLFRRQQTVQRPVVYALLLSVAVIPVWYLLFLGHTIVHTRFMVRPLVWIIAIGAIFACWTVIDLRRRRLGVVGQSLRNSAK